jgi:signal transduction histidine kinase
MNFLYRLSIKAKITAIIASVSFFAIILGFSILTINNIANLKQDLVKQNAFTAKLLSQYLLYSLIFDVPKSAVNQLDNLSALGFITSAEVYNADGHFFASYKNIPASNKILLQKESSANFINNELHIIEPVWNEGEFLGTIILRVSTRNLAQKVKEYIIMLIITGSVIGIFIILMANSFQKIISQPILRLASLIEKITENKDFSIRINKIFDDEIGTLYDGFNNMLEQLVKRDIETLRAQEALKESQELFSTFMEVLPAAAYLKNADSTYRFVNQFLVERLGANDWVGKPIFKSYPDHPKDKGSDEKALVNLVHYESSVYNSENKLMFFENWKFPIRRKGKPTLIGGIAIDISKRKTAERKIQYYIHELERNNKELEEFNYVASHDLREPLRTITSYCDLLREDLDDKVTDDVSEDINFITDAATRMNVLIQDLLQLSRAGRVDFSREPVDLNQIILNVKSDLELKIKETNAKIISDKLPVVQGDAVQLSRVFQNLITNALKFRSDKNPNIQILLNRKNGKIEVLVKDNGIGMEEQYFDMIFSPFKRLHSRERYKGTGIGLAICKKIIDRHSGNIRVESKPGEGTSFIITLEEYTEK